MLAQIYNIDFYILNAIQTIRTPILDKIFTFITHCGTGGAIWIIIAIIMLINKKSRKYGIMICIGLILGLITGNIILKSIIMRDRPFTFDTAVLSADTLVIHPPSERYSFPSGHTLSSFICAWLILSYNKKAGIAAIAAAAAIAFSRLYLYVHFPSDILGAILLSVIISYTVYKIVSYKITLKG